MDETCSLVYRIEERYLDEEEPALDDDVIITTFSTSPCKIATSGGLELICLNHTKISHIGDISRFSSLVGHVLEDNPLRKQSFRPLGQVPSMQMQAVACQNGPQWEKKKHVMNRADLGWNDLNDWKTVGTILAHMPVIRALNLSHNPLAPDEENPNLPLIPSLRMLVLNGTHLSFSLLRKILAKMPQLTELHLSENNFDLSDDSSQPAHDNVSTVHMNRCDLKHWSDVTRVLQRFPNRKTVFLYDNPIKAVKHEVPPAGLDTLKCINISKTEVSDWDSINQLNMLPGLIDLRIMNVPLLDEYAEEERHHLIISRLPNLLALNGSVITLDGRETAERFFIRYYQDSEEKPEHYQRLLGKHGQLERLVSVDLTPKYCCTVNVICEETNYKARLNINLQKTVGQLMKSLEKQVGIKYPRMRMMLENGGPFVDELQYHNISLFSLRIEDNNTFIIQSKIVQTRRRNNTNSPV